MPPAGFTSQPCNTYQASCGVNGKGLSARPGRVALPAHHLRRPLLCLVGLGHETSSSPGYKLTIFRQRRGEIKPSFTSALLNIRNQMGFGLPRGASGRRGARPRKSQRRMRRAVAMRPPLAQRGRLGAEEPRVVDAFDRPAAVAPVQFPESLQIRPRRPPNQTKHWRGRDSRSRRRSFSSINEAYRIL